MKQQSVFLFISLGIMLVFSSCRHDETDLSTAKEVCFNPDVQTIFSANCAITDCHNSVTAESGLILDNYQGIMEGVTPGDPLKSEVYKAITSEWFEMMPPEKPLTQEQRIIIRLWIDQGAKNSQCSTGK